MKMIDGLTGLQLCPAHIDDACALVREAGWNQTAADWRMMMRTGTAMGYAAEGRVVATAVAMGYGDAFGWIGMVLVAGAWRRRGIATHLLDSCIATLEAHGLVPGLDATPAGEAVYAPLGFVGGVTISRWRRPAGGRPATPDSAVRAVRAEDLPWIVQLDQAVFGGDRAAVLRDFAGRAGFQGWILEDGGYLLSREGRMARQLGPLCAHDIDTARRLLATAIAERSEALLIDVPDRHAELTALLDAQDFAVERPFRRMFRGRSGGFGDEARMYALAGPELG